MFFPLSKIVFFTLTPSNFLILLGIVGAGLSFTTGLSGLGRWLGLCGVLGLAAVGFLPLAALALLPLEDRFPAYSGDGEGIAGVIVLGGAVETATSLARGQLTVNDAGERAIALADLARRFPQARLMFSGGSGGLQDGGTPEADAAERYGGTLGLSPGRLILERASRNTRENAMFSARAVSPRPEERWLLVTSAWHMPRAMGCFRQAGFAVVAYPVDYRTAGWRDAGRVNGFASLGLFEFDLAVKEWIGLIAYRLAGYTDAWLPAPSP